jgi:SAM-dependent methyltransferase
MILDELLRALPTFTVSSGGPPHLVADLTLKAAEQSFPFLARLAQQLGHDPMVPIPVENFASSESAQAAAGELKTLFDAYGSDKAQHHNYHYLYGAVLGNARGIGNVLEIGLGTNNEDVVSNMGAAGHPGASLRAFRDYLPNAQVFGADIDRRVLFSEERIRTFFVDQTDLGSMEELFRQLPAEFDLIVDDGLHAPNANLATAVFAIGRLRPGGVFIVEDLHPAHFPVWQVVATLLPKDLYRCFLMTALRGCLFVVQRGS